MKQTENYHLTQWEKSDRILMEDFNRDNAALDTALTAQREAHEALTQTVADQAQAIAKCGNCRIFYGSYTGSGTYGKDNPCTLTFDGDPLYVIIKGAVGSAPTLGIQAMRGWDTAYSGSDNHSTICHLTWGHHTLSWYNGQSITDQFNTKGAVYPYIAFFTQDA